MRNGYPFQNIQEEFAKCIWTCRLNLQVAQLRTRACGLGAFEGYHWLMRMYKQKQEYHHHPITSCTCPCYSNTTSCWRVVIKSYIIFFPFAYKSVIEQAKGTFYIYTYNLTHTHFQKFVTICTMQWFHVSFANIGPSSQQKLIQDPLVNRRRRELKAEEEK